MKNPESENTNILDCIVELSAMETFENYKKDITPFVAKIEEITNEYYKAAFYFSGVDIGEKVGDEIFKKTEELVNKENIRIFKKLMIQAKLKGILDKN